MTSLDRYSMIALSIFAIIAVNIANADQCRKSCGYIAPETFALDNKACDVTGNTGNYTRRIDWDDGSYSIYSINANIPLVIGSCCSQYKLSHYNTGVVMCGRFAGENVILVNTFSDDTQTCNDCHFSNGLTATAGVSLLSIGTKGVGQWIECTGNLKQLYSQALTSTPVQSVYYTFSAVYGDCSNCVKSF